MAKRFTEWIQTERKAEEARGGLGWKTIALSIYWQQRISVAIHNSIASRMASKMTVNFDCSASHLSRGG